MNDESNDLAPDDARILGLESDAVMGHTLKLVILEPGAEPLDVDALRTRVASRVACQPRAREMVDSSGDTPRWIEAADFDIDDHVRRHPATCANQADLWRVVSTLMSEHLDRGRPLWTLDVIGPLDDGREAIAARIHHAMADGIAAVGFLRDVLWDPQPEAVRVADGPGVKPEKRQSRLAEWERMPAALGRELGHLGSASPLDKPITGLRELAFSTATLAEMKAIGAALPHAATVNDVLLATIAGGLRRWLGTSAHLRAQVPVSLHHRDEDGSSTGNRDSFINVDLPLGENDPMKRLDLVRSQTAVRKQRDDAQELYDLFHALGRIPKIGAAVQRLADSSREFSLSISNVPGPSTAIDIDGRRVEHLFSSSEPGMHHALRISAISCAGTVGIGLCADPEALPGMGALADAIDEAFAELRTAALGA